MPKPDMDGNAEQIRAIVDQLAGTIIKKIEARGTIVDFHTNEEFHEWLDERVENKARKWIVALVIAYIIPIMIGVYYAGKVTEMLESALEAQEVNTQSLYSRGQFVRDQQDFNCRMSSVLQQTHNVDIGPCRFESADSPLDRRR